MALAMTGMLVSLLMSSLYYGTRVQASLADELQVREKTLSRASWFSQSVQSCLPAAPETGVQFLGTASEIRCFSASPLQARLLQTPQRIQWVLRPSASNVGQVELIYRDLDDEKAIDLVIQRFDGLEARFVYRGVDGKEVAGWPVSEKAQETLPRWVQLSTRAGNVDHSQWATALRADPWLEQEIKNPFGIELPR